MARWPVPECPSLCCEALALVAPKRHVGRWKFVKFLSRLIELGVAAIDLDPDVLYVQQGRLLTSAGTAAGIDCCLHLLRERLGADMANRVARRLVVPPHRQGGQAQFIEQPLPQTASGHRLTALIDHVRAYLDAPHSLDSLAAHTAMSRRCLTRHFKALTGTSVLDWLLAECLNLAQRLLEQTQQPIEHIATLAGFGTALSLRQHFRQQFGVTPREWRGGFSGPR